jgi:hypothetical protein
MGFGQHHLISFYFWIFENLLWTCVLEQASREYKFHNFWTYGSKVMGKQKIYEKSGRAGMCWSQPARVDHMCKKMWAGGRRRISQGGSLRHPRWKGGWLAISCRPLTTIWQITGCSSTGPPSLFLFLFLFFGCYKEVWRWAWHFGRMVVWHSHFLNLAPTTGRVKSSIPHETWKFHFLSIFCLK